MNFLFYKEHFLFAESSSNDDEILPEVLHRRKKKVAFQENGKESRDERLDRLVRLLKTEEKENDQAIAQVKGKYSKDFHDFKEKQAEKIKENKNSIGKTSKSVGYLISSFLFVFLLKNLKELIVN